MLLAAGGLAAFCLDERVAIPIGIVGLGIGSISIKLFWAYYIRARERRQAIKELVFKGFCPEGLNGPYDPSDAFSRCEEASYSTCLMCTMTWMGEPFSDGDYKEALFREAIIQYNSR
jgi:hypothetical protein